MDLQLRGKKAIVTGGTAGIGVAIARVLTEEGAEVTIPGRNSKKLSEAVSSLPGGASWNRGRSCNCRGRGQAHRKGTRDRHSCEQSGHL
jgi:NAD(P)-dependent dehydrogenase (short-subunit alcohol dehydrogenase family)